MRIVFVERGAERDRYREKERKRGEKKRRKETGAQAEIKEKGGKREGKR